MLERSGIEDKNGPLGFLRQAHATERGLVHELEEAMKEFQAGNHEAATRFATTAWQFRQHLLDHIQQEDAILFCLTEELLDDPDKDDLAYSLAHANGKNGKQSTQHYERVAQELETAWAI
jgi:hemerythrin-like domain-containing protein